MLVLMIRVFFVYATETEVAFFDARQGMSYGVIITVIGGCHNGRVVGRE